MGVWGIMSLYVSPQGLWRMQVEHVCSHLKAYALSSPDFQSSMGNPQMGKVGMYYCAV